MLAAMIADAPAAVELRAEYLVNPVNLDSVQPRLSWIDSSTQQGWVQGGYQILVASRPSLLATGKADLWDSGKVVSRESTQISYSGKALESREACFWRVRVWGRDGQVSDWSPVNSWQMGLLNPSDWQGSQWIGRQGAAVANPAPYLRKDFDVAGRVRRAMVYACGLGYADLYLNGKSVSAERDPAYTNFDKRVLYVGYDVTHLLKRGKNALGAILGTGWYDVHDKATWNFDRAPWRGRPRLKLLLAIETTDGKTTFVPSDTSWKATTGPILRDGIYTGEVYDARKELPGWNLPGYDASRWSAADAMDTPKGKLVARACTGVVLSENFVPKSIKEPKPGVYLVDFGQNFTGHVRLKLKAPAGTRVTMRYSERVGTDGMIVRSQIDVFMAKATPPQPFQTDTYICKGGGEEVWEQRFSYSGFRYAEVTGFPGKPVAANFLGRFEHTGFDSAGNFECSNDLLNKIQRATRYSYMSNAQSIPTDCPQREKNGWTGDAQLACEAGLMNFRSEPFYTKWLDDFAGTEDEKGMVSLIVPSGGWGRGSRHPAWDSAYPIVANDLFEYDADRSVLVKHYANLKRYVDSLATELKDGVLTFDSLGDWVPWSTETPSTFTSTVYLLVDARILERIAKLEGDIADAAKYSAMAEEVKSGINRHFYDAEKGLYANGSQTALSMALYFDVVPAELRSRVFGALVANVEAQGHIDTGILGAKYLLRVLSEEGRTDLAYKIVARKEQPGWGWWIGQGATTLWEDWKGESSLNHIMFGDVSNWFIQWIAGIGLDTSAPGFSKVVIRPQVVGDLKWAKAWHESPHGRISSAWRLDGGVFHLDVTIPANVTARVVLPYKDVVVAGGDGVPVSHRDGGSTVELGSGTYSFTARIR